MIRKLQDDRPAYGPRLLEAAEEVDTVHVQYVHDQDVPVFVVMPSGDPYIVHIIRVPEVQS